MTLSTPAKISHPLVVLIHGLHHRAWVMRPLAKHLRAADFHTYELGYRSVRDPIAQHSQQLNNWLLLNHNPEEPIHLVGHSLGGLVIRDFIQRYPSWQIDRCVTLGTPHSGSISADYVKKLLSPFIGHAYQGGLDGTVAPLPDDICLGVIAGSSPYGLGQFFLRHHNRRNNLPENERDHDGSVYIYETRLANANDHIVLPVNHTAMLVNPQVAEQTLYFLQHGQFKR